MRVEDVLKSHGVGVGGRFEELNVMAIVGSMEEYLFDTSNNNNELRGMLKDEDYVYAVGRRVFYKAEKGNLSIIKTHSVDLQNNIGGSSLAQDEEFVYLARNQSVDKYDKETFTRSSYTGSYGGSIWDIAVDEDFIYATGQYPVKFKKYGKRDLLLVAESERITDSNFIKRFAMDSDYLYSADGSDNKLKKYDKNTLLEVAQSNADVFSTGDVVIDENYVYIRNEDRLSKFNKNTLVKVSETDDIFTSTSALAIDKNTLYTIAGSSNRFLGHAAAHTYELDARTLEMISRSPIIERSGSSSQPFLDIDGKFLLVAIGHSVLKMTRATYIKR